MNEMDPSVAAITRGILLLQKFDPKTMNFLLWQNSFEFIVELLKIPDNKKSYFLLCKIETVAYVKIHKKVVPVNPFDVHYDVLIALLEEFFSPYQGSLAARFRFDMRNQIVGESVHQYANALRQIVHKCCYGIRSNIFLIIRFTIGVKSNAIQQKLLQIPNITFDDAVHLAERMEFYEKQFYEPKRLAAISPLQEDLDDQFDCNEKISDLYISKRSFSK